jgi:hypothetical protein
VAALLDGHRLTGERAFLDKAEELIRRVIHPADDVAGRVALRTDRQTIDAENRWFYVMFLQTLGKYLDHKAERGEVDGRYAHARESLLHYARWMAKHEYPYLDRPEVLEYPTETWAAQDLRKCDVFLFAARHADGEERRQMLERAEFFFRYAVTALSGMKTRTLCRPVVLLLSHGWMRAWLIHNPEAVAPRPTGAHDFGRPEVFVAQKARAKKRVKLLLAGIGIAIAILGLVGMLRWLAA